MEKKQKKFESDVKTLFSDRKYASAVSGKLARAPLCECSPPCGLIADNFAVDPNDEFPYCSLPWPLR